MPRLLRRREVWWPTWWGSLWLVAIVAALGALAGTQAYALLAPQQPNPQARTLVVEGWLDPDALRQVSAVVRAHRYERVLTTGGPLAGWVDDPRWTTSAERAAAFLRANGVTDVPVIAVPSPETTRDRTYVMATTLRDWAAAQSPPIAVAPFDLLSSGVHTRRSWLVYRMVFGADATSGGAIAVRPSEYDPQRWWATSAGVKAVLGETLSFTWTKCCFWP